MSIAEKGLQQFLLQLQQHPLRTKEAVILDQIVSVTHEVYESYKAMSMTPENLSPNAEGKGSGTSPRSGRVYMSKAQDVVTSVLVKGESMDQRLQVSDKTMPAIIIDEKKLNNTVSTIKSSRYVTAGTTWLKGALGKVAKAGQVVGLKTRQK
ncbi:hypothetical protein LXL04_029258 [Taraxacum kok-saghyz]